MYTSFLRLVPSKVWWFLAIIMLVICVGLWQRQTGKSIIQDQWDAEKIMTKALQDAAIAQREKENTAARFSNQLKLFALRADYETELQKIKRHAAVSRNDSLRMPAAACNGPARTPDTQSAQGSPDPTAGTIALPDEIAGHLRQLMEEADTIVAACRIAQRFVVDNALVEE